MENHWNIYANCFYFLTDINECENNPCEKHQQCINTNGSFRCVDLIACRPGFKISDDGTHCEGNW